MPAMLVWVGACSCTTRQQTLLIAAAAAPASHLLRGCDRLLQRRLRVPLHAPMLQVVRPPVVVAAVLPRLLGVG
jgi:hypothetical protein